MKSRKYDNLYECGMKGLIDNLMKTNSPCQQGPIQPDSNIGEFGANKEVTSVSISEEPDGSVKVSTDAICVKLHAPVIGALKKFFEMKENISGEE